jgi:hypothetical protein
MPPGAPRYTCEYCGLNTAVIIPRRFHRARVVALIIEAIILFPVAALGTLFVIALCAPHGTGILRLLPVGLLTAKTGEEAMKAIPPGFYIYLAIFAIITVLAVISVSRYPPYSTSERIHCVQCGWEKDL